MIQSLVITDWHPTMNPNGGQKHWAVQRARHKVDAETTWSAARFAGWKFQPGRVGISITLVYSRRPLPDYDNCVARCKGIIDGLKGEFFKDDSPDWMEPPVVRPIVERGVKEVRITLQGMDDEAERD